MGKNRESGRSKTRPSSSSLAASLLPTGVSCVGFGGYVGSSRVDVPVSREERPPRAVVDGEIAQHLNRLGRKDPTTKLKALTALSTIFMEKCEDEVVQIIPQWVFEYKRLLTDYNREVRRATHETMSNLVIAVRRALAPHLKSLMGPWWFSQFDEVPELSQAARRSLEVAFPAQEKRLDALTLYSNEIFLYLDENLKLTPQAMSDKATPADELEDMHNRVFAIARPIDWFCLDFNLLGIKVISMSLLAIAALIEILLGAKPQNQKSEVPGPEPKGAEKAKMATVSTAGKMFSSHNYFLEFLKSRNPRVRSSTYTILGSFIKHIHHAFKDMKVISAAVLGSFQENDPSCHSSMWDMILLFSRAFPYCWEYVSIQKNALSRLCHLLRNGFNGSSKISYPVLVLLLDLLPLKTVFGENFIMSFFESFWAGKTPHSPSEDRQAFFKAFKECFLWGLFNASRCLFEDGVHPFQVNFIDIVLVKLLWHEYISFERSEQDVSYRTFSSSKEDFNGFAKSSRVETYPRSYVDDVGRCILEILSVISMKDQSLLTPYCVAFQKDCLDIFQRGVGAETFSKHMDQIANFFLLLEQLSFGKDHIWPLRYLAGPLIADTFPLIKSLDSPDAIRVLTVVAQVFGPKLFVLNLFTYSKSQNGANIIEDCSDELNTKDFLQHYKDYLVPWCLGGSSSSLGSRLDLLIRLIDKEVFYEQWHSIVVYATSSNENFPDDNFVTNADRAYILAVLLEKIRDKCRRKEILADYNEGPDFNSSQWKHGLLENCAISVACHPFSSVSHARFVSAAIGDSLQVDDVHFLSKAAIVRIFEAILKILVDVLLMSSHDWIKGACSLVFNRCPHLALQHCSSVAENVEMALFSFEVLNSSFFCLNCLDRDNKLVAFILTAILIIEWERRMSPPDMSDEHEGYLDSMVNGISLEPKGKVGWASQDLPGARFYLGSRASAFRIKMSSSHWRSLSPHNLMILRNALVQTARSAIFNTNTLSNEEMPTLCCSWILDVFERISPTHADEQTMLDELFSEGKGWPLWVKPDFHGGMRSAILISRSTSADEKSHQQFAAFVEKIVCNLGVDKVLLGFDSKSPTGAPCILYSRSWLAAELLCTWKWSGGSVVHSFLPLFFGYAKDIAISHGGDLVSSVISILLDGAILHGSSYRLSFLNVWAVSEDEIGCILDPFLRALLTILFTLVVQENVWCKDDVVGLYRCVVGKLFVGTSINRSCLRVLPFILNVIGNKVLDRNSPESEDLVQSNILEWLQIPLSLPPLALENQTNEDLEGWIQVIVSLYPLNAEGFGSFKVAQTRNICNSEKMLILANFRKQRSTSGKSAAESYHSELSPSLSIQMLLTRLTAVSVGYCWQEFDDDDWDFVLCNLRRWIGLSVAMMEEITEKIDDAVNSKDTKEAIIRRLELVVQVEEPAQMDLSLTAIIILSLILELSDEKKLASNEDCSILEKRSLQKDRILEDVLRLFFSTGAAEAIAKSFDEEASRVVATSRFVHSRFWGLVASCVTCSANHLRNSAVQSMELWGLSTGAVSSLFALLFSCKPMHSLQFAAYHVLSTEPLCFISLYKESSLNAYIDSCQDSSLPHDNAALLDEPMSLRDEISVIVETPSLQLIGMDLLAHDRINFFLAWALLLSHLQSLSSSLARERLTQHIQDSISSIILDLIFQYIPLKSNLAQSSRKKDSKLPIEVLNAANAATHAITTCSLGFAVESLWPIEVEQMASLAGSIYGLMICILPAYVRNWFSRLCDRSLSSAIESFTKGWCSPSLVADEFSQIKAASIADENFSVSVNSSAFEIVATYKKEETGMDLVIHLPSCYPLQPVDVDCTRSLGVSNEKRRKWLLSLTAFVRNQNGAIAEAIRTWKSNFDKEFQGVEECPICYSIIHTTSHSLPRLACKTCKHKFHSACLYKWFSTSHKSLCPLCQMPF